jgi:hypothetical protein
VLCRGSDLQLPFRCPLDFLLPIKSLEASKVDYRHAGFLQLPQVPVTVRKSQAVVQIAAARPANPFPKPSHTVGHGATVWPGIRQAELLQAVAPVSGEAVLQLRWAIDAWTCRLPCSCCHAVLSCGVALDAFDASLLSSLLCWLHLRLHQERWDGVCRLVLLHRA